MRHLFIALMLACASAAAQNINEQPLFGEKPRAQELLDADRQFVDTAVKAAGSREAAAVLEVQRAWKQLKQGDTEVAVQSFNQAYLLDPKNAEVYWGLGNAMTQQGKFDVAARMFGHALALSPENSKLLADVGLANTRAAVGTAQDPVEQAKQLQGALSWFEAAEKLDPNYAQIYANRAVTFYLLGNYTESWNNVVKAEALDKSSVDPKLHADLSGKLPRPVNAAIPAAETAAAPAEAKAKPGATTSATPATPAAVKTEAVAAQPSVQAVALASQEPVPAAGKEVMPQAPGNAARTEQRAEVPSMLPADTASASPEAEAPKSKRKKLRVVSGQPKTAKGPDKRACLNLPTNEAIMRCVYPRGK